VSVPPLDDAELTEVEAALPALVYPLKNPALRNILRARPYFLDKALEISWSAERPVPERRATGPHRRRFPRDYLLRTGRHAGSTGPAGARRVGRVDHLLASEEDLRRDRYSRSPLDLRRISGIKEGRRHDFFPASASRGRGFLSCGITRVKRSTSSSGLHQQRRLVRPFPACTTA